MRQLALALCVLAASAGPAVAQAAAPIVAADRAVLTLAQQEEFLREARIVKTKSASKGVTGTLRATLSDGTTTHDASIQMVDVTTARYEGTRGMELNFRDYWAYNVAAYRLGLMLGLDNIPPSISRRYKTKEAAFTWWIDDVMMDEESRAKEKANPPDSTYWRAQNDIVRIFDELIANVDRNQGNVLIDKRWKLWMIDHTRAFRLAEVLRRPAAIARCEAGVLARLKGLTKASLKAELDDYLSPFEIDAILKRRDLIVARIEELGPSALYELKAPTR